ncbi:hypothetical protein WJX81_000302 [Elliptochloris bilobata]|uniref:VASt domain-containing protein n=1 Tax=Elliptochloris bilobata TaxID=381761 RepID=A0AAW1RRM7_9CHLO
MVRGLELSDDLPGISIQEFCELFKRAETFYAYHWWLHKNENMRVGKWEGEDGLTRRMSFLVPYGAPRWFKRAVGTEVVKIRDTQCLEMEEAGGRLVAMTMVSRPQLLVPGGSYLPMGDVRFRVAAADFAGVPGCKVTTKVTCTAEGLKWLWALRGAVERVMVAQCKEVAETFVAFCGRACREGLDTAQLPIQRTHSRSLSRSLGRTLSRTLSRGSGLRRSNSGAGGPAGTPGRDEGVRRFSGLWCSGSSGGVAAAGTPGREEGPRASAADSMAVRKYSSAGREEGGAPLQGKGSLGSLGSLPCRDSSADSDEALERRGTPAGRGTPAAAPGNAGAGGGEESASAAPASARSAPEKPLNGHARSPSGSGLGSGVLGGSGASIASTTYFDASEESLPGSPTSIEEARRAQHAGAEVWVTRASSAFGEDVPCKPQPPPPRRRRQAAERAQWWNGLSSFVRGMRLPCTTPAVRN